jgi:hypothetical protein
MPAMPRCDEREVRQCRFLICCRLHCEQMVRRTLVEMLSSDHGRH